MPSPGELFHLWFEEIWNGRDESKVARYLAPDGILHALDMSGEDAHGPEAFHTFRQDMLSCFPDIHFTVHEVVEDADRAAGRWSAEATHAGDGMGAMATGEKIAITGMSMIRVADGQITEAWNEWDRIRLATACRIMPQA